MSESSAGMIAEALRVQRFLVDADAPNHRWMLETEWTEEGTILRLIEITDDVRTVRAESHTETNTFLLHSGITVGEYICLADEQVVLRYRIRRLT